MARVFTIDSIQGNSNLGNPVFSNYGKMTNFQYICLSPVKDDYGDRKKELEALEALTKENMEFKLQRNIMEQCGNDQKAISVGAQTKKIQDILKSYD